MKNQATEVNFTVMLYAGLMYTGLVISGWLLMRLIVACFKLPSLLNEKQLQMQELEKHARQMLMKGNFLSKCISILSVIN